MFSKVIYRNSDLPQQGPTYVRQAVRSVIVQDRQLLMAYLETVGEFKFPGGGVRKNETHSEALVRETLEEVGARIASIGELLGEVTEYDHAIEAHYNLFKMTSYYYQVKISEPLDSQDLDEYEKELGFRPVWVDIDEAIRANAEKVLHPVEKSSEGLRRELYVLQELKKILPY